MAQGVLLDGGVNDDGTPPPPFKPPRYEAVTCSWCRACWRDTRRTDGKCIYSLSPGERT